MKNHLPINGTLTRFEDTLHLVTCDIPISPIPYSDEDKTKSRINQLRWTHHYLQLMVRFAANSIELIELYKKDDDDET